MRRTALACRRSCVPARARAAALVLSTALTALVLAPAAFADTTATPVATMTVGAPIAVRASHSFLIRGMVSPAASPGESVTIAFSRKSGSAWSLASTASVTVGTRHQFSCTLSAGRRGHWRVSASLAATSTHTTATASAQLKAVGAKVVALTFDDGPWPSSTAKIVGALKKGDAQATFFMLGSQIGSRKKLARAVVAGGNAIGVHSWNHAIMVRRSSSVNARDLARCIKAVRSATGIRPKWFRPPYGSTNKSLRKTAASKGLRQVIWTVDTLDWKYRVTSSVVSRAMSGTRNGSIVLMHDGGGPRKATAAAVPIVIRKLRAKGYDFVTLDEMVALGYKVR